ILVGGILFFLIAPAIQRACSRWIQDIDSALKKVPIRVFVCGSIGLIAGLVIAFLISRLWDGIQIPGLRIVLSVTVYILMGYLGVNLSARKADELTAGFKGLNSSRPPKRSKAGKNRGRSPAPKILDTSVIIDGRIADIMKTGFIEGQIVIPEFVLVELRHIADSSQSLKRNRGRRGLDVLNKIQEQYGIEIYNTENEKRLKDIPEVDVKLLELADSMNGKVVTNDYNLNKVAAIKGVEVLNINELANTLKPVVLPGEEMTVTPVRQGKEAGQALAYLDDGTMIVVEEGAGSIGQEIQATVTSVLQTSAGRMIFVRKD
ncbi:MAG: PIN domain-containing protein, partial [Firmicutes bacterium]|nr:PIN domain-containing protein [Bacillota bacterium]